MSSIICWCWLSIPNSREGLLCSHIGSTTYAAHAVHAGGGEHMFIYTACMACPNMSGASGYLQGSQYFPGTPKQETHPKGVSSG